ncbi:hypothetical protein GCM10010452_48830 [Crossiella cryophila]
MRSGILGRVRFCPFGSVTLSEGASGAALTGTSVPAAPEVFAGAVAGGAAVHAETRTVDTVTRLSRPILACDGRTRHLQVGTGPSKTITVFILPWFCHPEVVGTVTIP